MASCGACKRLHHSDIYPKAMAVMVLSQVDSLVGEKQVSSRKLGDVDIAVTPLWL